MYVACHVFNAIIAAWANEINKKNIYIIVKLQLYSNWLSDVGRFDVADFPHESLSCYK